MELAVPITLICMSRTVEARRRDQRQADIAHNFSGKTETTLATPTPLPTGCSLTNLVGTWVSDNDSKVVLTMDTDGNVTDNEGVSGNWYLVGTTVTLTYYGTKSMKLSADGKHISGSGASYTRKC